jgi:phosphoglycolate phosphatase
MTALRDSADPTGKSPSRLVVFDFDDTLYDWIGHFVPALEAMVRAAAPLLGVSTTALRLEMQAVHTRYGNTEQPFALLETESTERLLGDHTREEQRQVLSPAFEAFDRVRARKLRLYDDVIPTFNRLREERVPLAGYSTAPSVNLAKRIKMLGIADFFTRIYASPFTGKPYPGKRAGLDGFEITEMPRPKPDPGAVERIARDFDVAPRDTLFVGDSIASDIAPAIVSGARAVLVQRPTASGRDWLPDLLQVSHRRAESRSDSADLSDAALSRVPRISSLTELWRHFTFAPPRATN